MLFGNSLGGFSPRQPFELGRFDQIIQGFSRLQFLGPELA